MKKDFIYIRICDGMNLSKTKIILKDKCNKIVYEEIIVNLNNIKIPICHNDIYKLFIISGLKIIVIPLMLKERNILYNINNNFNKNHLITVLLEDANNSNIKIKRGEILLWEDTLFQ